MILACQTSRRRGRLIKIETERDVEMWRLGRLMRAVIKIGMLAELGEIRTDFKHKFASVCFCDKKLHSCSMWRSGWHIYEMKNDENNQDTQRTWMTSRWAFPLLVVPCGDQGGK